MFLYSDKYLFNNFSPSSGLILFLFLSQFPLIVEREGDLFEGKYETDVFMSILDREYQSLKDEF